MRKRKTKPVKQLKQPFERRSFTMSEDLLQFAKRRAAGPRYCRNLSAYVRDLILDDAKAAGVQVE